MAIQQPENGASPEKGQSPKTNDIARKGAQNSHAAGSGSSTGDPGNARGQGQNAPKDSVGH